jgi:hypothetical protein
MIARVVVERRAYDADRDTHSADAALAELASRQHGVVSRAQARAIGLSRDAVRRRLQRHALQHLGAVSTRSATRR